MTVRQLATAIAYVAMAVILGLLYLVEPFWRIRIGRLPVDKIGALAWSTEVFMRRLQLHGRPARTSWFFVASHTANRTLLDMWKRELAVTENRLLAFWYFAALPLLARTRFHQPIEHEVFEHEEASLGAPALRFTAEEDARGRAELARMGIGPDDWYVCIHARDPAYLGTRTGFGANESLRALSMRDCSIHNYLEAARWVVERGGWVLRMGAVVEQPLPPNLHPRIIDYATNGSRSDFMDIFVPAHCRFFLGNTSGLFTIATMFNVPVGGGNWVPNMWTGLGNRFILLPKLLRRIADDRLMSFPELAAMGLFVDPTRGDKPFRAYMHRLQSDEMYAELGLRWEDSDPQALLDLAMDLDDLVNGVAPSAEARRLQEAYVALYGDGPNNTPYAPRPSARFVLRYRHLIETAQAAQEFPA